MGKFMVPVNDNVLLHLSPDISLLLHIIGVAMLFENKCGSMCLGNRSSILKAGTWESYARRREVQLEDSCLS